VERALPHGSQLIPSYFRDWQARARLACLPLARLACLPLAAILPTLFTTHQPHLSPTAYVLSLRMHERNKTEQRRGERSWVAT
jgi:hypothetical protein